MDELRERLRETREAAERIVRDVPPQGWAGEPQRNAAAEEIQALVTLMHALRDAVPPDLWEQLREVARQLLLLLRAMLDFVVERIERGAQGVPGSSPAPGTASPQDIPIA